MTDHEQIINHFAATYGPVDKLALQEIIPVMDDGLSVAINVIRPTVAHDYITLFTLGMSDRAMTVPNDQAEYRYAELYMHLPSDWPLDRDAWQDGTSFWPFQWLRQIAYHPHQNKTWLGGLYAIIANDDPPQPLAMNTALSCLLLFSGGSLDPLDLGFGKIITFYNVYPIYTEERDFELENGVYPLLERFAAHELHDVVDLNRVNVALA